MTPNDEVARLRDYLEAKNFHCEQLRARTDALIETSQQLVEDARRYLERSKAIHLASTTWLAEAKKRALKV